MKLVLLPGLDGTGVLFRPLLAALPANIEPIVVSYPTQDPLGYNELLSLVSKRLPYDEPYILLGESFGGPLSLRIAATHPKNLRGLILCGSFVSCPFSFAPLWAAYAIHPFHFRAFPFFLWLQRVLKLYETEEHAALGREAIMQVAPSVFAHRVREIIRVDVTRELLGVKVPILYIQGTRDRIVVASNLAQIKKLRPDVQEAQIDSGHMILKTRPAESARTIERFVQSLDKAVA